MYKIIHLPTGETVRFGNKSNESVHYFKIGTRIFKVPGVVREYNPEPRSYNISKFHTREIAQHYLIYIAWDNGNKFLWRYNTDESEEYTEYQIGKLHASELEIIEDSCDG